MDGVVVRQQVSGHLWTAVDVADLATDQMPSLGASPVMDVEGPPVARTAGGPSLAGEVQACHSMSGEDELARSSGERNRPA
jgi:hypothetical protein